MHFILQKGLTNLFLLAQSNCISTREKENTTDTIERERESKIVFDFLEYVEEFVALLILNSYIIQQSMKHITLVISIYSYTSKHYQLSLKSLSIFWVMNDGEIG